MVTILSTVCRKAGVGPYRFLPDHEDHHRTDGGGPGTGTARGKHTDDHPIHPDGTGRPAEVVRRLPDLGSRWIWSTVGGVLAAVAGVVGCALTRRPRRP